MSDILSGQIALVTGGSRGIGRAIAEAFARAGAQVIITARTPESAAQAADEIGAATDTRVEGFACDSTKAADCAGLVGDLLERHGRLDILVNNAGITADKLILRMNDDDWLSVFDTNLHGAFYFSRAAAKAMLKKRSGRIINISSIVGLTGNAGQTNYAATKAGLIGFTKSLAKELGSRGVTVNAIAPGYIETAMTEALDPKMKEKLLEFIPLGRLGRPEDVAAAAVFLASPAAAYITGETLRVDGGMAM